MIIYTKDLLEKLGNHSEQYMTVVTQDVDSKRYTIYYMNLIICENKDIIIDIIRQKKFFSTREVFDTISHFCEENTDSVVKLKFPEGQLIDDFEFWDVLSPVENSLSLILGIKNMKID